MIVNDHPSYFYVLRFNKLVHDIIIERRAKPHGKILSFTALRMDSVNAGWFDYEQLPYLFFGKGNRMFFVFEKARNNGSAVYMKQVDTTGRTSGFVELGRVTKSRDADSVTISFSLNGDGNILLVKGLARRGRISKSIALYDPLAFKTMWEKQLPAESPATGYSTGYVCNAAGDLYYLLLKPAAASTRLQHGSNDSLWIAALKHDSDIPSRAAIELYKERMLQSIRIHCDSGDVIVSAHYSLAKRGDKETEVFFLNERYNKQLERLYSHATPLKPGIATQLNFYDGTEDQSAGTKSYSPAATFSSESHLFRISERTQQNYFKEMIVWRSDMRNGKVTAQHVIPRKVYYFGYQTPFRNIGVASGALCNGSLFTFVLENPRNLNTGSADFRYHRFAEQNSIPGANVVGYILRENGMLEKKLVITNTDFETVPLLYRSSQCDHVFYQVRGSQERFAILQLNQL
jgi:hypothetical protein